MSNLLHLDCSAREKSVSRHLSRTFAHHWRMNHPDGGYAYRDLAADPIPHVDAAQVSIMTRLETAGVRDLAVAREAAETAEEKESWTLTWRLIEEVLVADTILIGLPMYNFSVPSSFKAWFDRLAIPPIIIDLMTGVGPLSGTRVVVTTARGGAYGPGTPRADCEFQESYLRKAFGMVALNDDLSFVHAELTKTAHVLRLKPLAAQAQASLDEALAAVRDLARSSANPAPPC